MTDTRHAVALDAPLTPEQVRDRMSDGYVTGVVRVDLGEVIDRDLEQFLDLISERLIGSDLLMDVSYRVVGLDGEALLLEVTGDPSNALLVG